MSEAVKKIEQTPESYSPKNKPEILRMAEKAICGKNKNPDIIPVTQPAIITRDSLYITGLSGNGAKTGDVWNAFESLYNKTPFEKADENGYELRFKSEVNEPEHGKDIHAGFLTAYKPAANGFTTVVLPASEYAVFDVIAANGYNSENENMNNWLVNNKDTYSQRVLDGMYFAVECYNEKFKNGIVEIWIPIEKVDTISQEQTPESYAPKNKPEILNMVETVKKNELQYPPQYRIKPKGKTAVYTGTGWPHSNAYPAIFSAVSLFYGKESRLNEKGEQINDDVQYHIQGALSTEAYGVQYSELYK
jgi:predicted transcriptional regulator YdeE